MKTRRLFISLICLGTFLVFMAQPCVAASAKILKIGALDSLTGWMAPGEMPTNQGEQLAVDWINEKGGITIKGKKYLLELVTEDTKSSPDGIIAAANKMVYNQGIKFFVGSVNTVMNIAANTVLIPAGALRIGHYNCLNPGELGPNLPLVFYANSSRLSMKPTLSYLKEAYPGIKTLAALHPGDGGEFNRMYYLAPIAQEYGMEIVYTGAWPGPTVDFTPIVKKALAANPDAIIFTDGWAYHAASMIKAARALGFKGPIFSTDSEIVSEVVEISGLEPAEGYFSAAWDINRPEMPPIMAEIAKRAKAKFGKANHWQVWGFNTLWILAQAIEGAQSLDPAVVAKYLRKMDTIKTPYGPATIGGQKTFGIQCVITAPQAIIRVKDGKIQFVKWVHFPTP